MLIAAVCEKMGWDYHTYMEQPVWFLRLLAHKFEIDAKNAEQAQK